MNSLILESNRFYISYFLKYWSDSLFLISDLFCPYGFFPFCFNTSLFLLYSFKDEEKLGD